MKTILFGLCCVAMGWMGWETRVVADKIPLTGLAAQDPTDSVESGEVVQAPPLTDISTIYSMDALDDEHRLRARDTVSFRVIEDKEDQLGLSVMDSGELDVPYYGRIKAEGKTCKELAFDIKRELEKDLYHKATVIIAVNLQTVSRGKVYLAGQIRRPGPMSIPAGEEFTVGKAILSAGGFSDFANQKKVKLVRPNGPGERDDETYIVNVEEIWEKGRTENDKVVRPGDLIIVSPRLINF